MKFFKLLILLLIANSSYGSSLRTLDADALISADHTKTLSFPAASDTLVGRVSTDTLTNKTISGASNTITNVSLTAGVTGTLPLGNGGTGQTTANASLNALIPVQTSNSGKFLTTDGSNTSWGTPAGGGGGSSFYGGLTYQAGASCSWGFSSSNYADPSAATCPTAVVTGAVTTPGTQLPQAVVNSIPTGTYRVEASVQANPAPAGGSACRLVDDAGTEIASQGGYLGSGSISFPYFLSGVITYGSTGNHTFKVQCKTALSASSVSLDNTTTENSSFYIRVYSLNGSGGTSPTSNYFIGSMSQSSTWSTSSSSYVDATNSGGNTLTTIYSNGLTITAAASNVAGIIITPVSTTDVFEVTATAAMFNSTALSSVNLRMTDGTTILGYQGLLTNSTGADVSVLGGIPGIYAPGTTSPMTVKIQMAAGGGTAQMTGSGIFQANVPTIQWKVVQIK